MNTYVRTCMCTRMYVRLLINTLDPLINDPKGRLIRGRGGRFNRGQGLQGGGVQKTMFDNKCLRKTYVGRQGGEWFIRGGGGFNGGGGGGGSAQCPSLVYKGDATYTREKISSGQKSHSFFKNDL